LGIKKENMTFLSRYIQLSPKIQENLFPVVKSEIQYSRKIFPVKLKKWAICEIKLVAKKIIASSVSFCKSGRDFVVCLVAKLLLLWQERGITFLFAQLPDEVYVCWTKCIIVKFASAAH